MSSESVTIGSIRQQPGDNIAIHPAQDVVSKPLPVTPTLPFEQRDLFFYLVLILCTLPLWLTTYLPLVDAPQHAAQVTALSEILAGHSFYSEAFALNWFTPYLVSYLALYVLTWLMPVTAAIQLVVSVAVAAFPLAVAALLREVGADDRLKWAAVPASYSLPLYWGFLSYILAVPLALWLLVLVMRHDRRPTRGGAIRLGLLSLGLFFCHIIALSVASLLAVTYLAARHSRAPASLVRRALPLAAPLPLMAIWMVGTYLAEAPVQNSPVAFQGIANRLLVVVLQFGGLDSYALSLNFWIAGLMLALPLLLRCRFSRQPQRWLPLAVGSALFLLTPASAFNTGFLYHRLAMFLVPLWLVAWEPASTPRRRPIVLLAVLTITVWIGVNAHRFAAFSSETRGLTTVLQSMEPDRHAAGLTGLQSSRNFRYPVFLHMVAWYQALGPGISDFNFAACHPQLVRYPDLSVSKFNWWLVENPLEFEWNTHEGDRYDYFLVHADQDQSVQLFKDSLDSVELVTRSGQWWLYQNRARSADSETFRARLGAPVLQSDSSLAP